MRTATAHVPTPDQPLEPPGPASFDEAAGAYLAATATPAARKGRRVGVVSFTRRFGDLDGWRAAPVSTRRSVRTEVASFVGYIILACQVPVDVEFVIASGCR